MKTRREKKEAMVLPAEPRGENGVLRKAARVSAAQVLFFLSAEGFSAQSSPVLRRESDQRVLSTVSESVWKARVVLTV